MIKTCKMKTFSFDAFLADVSGMPWEQMFTETDDIVLVNHWPTLFSQSIDKRAPICEMHVSEKFCPWINKDLKGLLHVISNISVHFKYFISF